MPVFAYKAFNAAGQLNAGVVDASSPADAEALLARDGLTAFEVISRNANAGPRNSASSQTLSTEAWWRREIGGPRRPRTTQLTGFANDLSILVGAGVSIDQSLRMLSEQSAAGFQRRLAESLRSEIVEGKPLSEAMRAHPQVFPDELIAIVSAAEASADLPGGLSRMATLMARRAQLQTELRSALLYPAVLLIASLGVLLVVISVLIPSIRPLFDEARAPMPVFIRLLDNAQSFATRNWALGLIALAALVFVGKYVLGRPAVAAVLDALMLRIPGWSTVVRRQEGARFTRALGAQVMSGVSLLSALVVASETLRNAETRRRVSVAIERIRDGAQPSTALRDTDPFPPLAYQLIAVGEEAGRLGPVLLQIAETFEQAQQTMIKRCMGLLTPLITLGLGLLVGLLMLSLMNAITGLNDFALR